MVIKYNEYCLGGNIEIDDKRINFEDLDNPENEELIKDTLHKIFETALDEKNMDYRQLFETLLSYSGEFGNSEKCDQCGSYDNLITLEI
jgi:hypothetical protein